MIAGGAEAMLAQEPCESVDGVVAAGGGPDAAGDHVDGAQTRAEHMITLDRSEGDRIGISYDDSDGVVIVVKVVKPGLVYAWNCMEEDQERWLMAEDQIIEVNGVSGNTELMLEECSKLQVLKFLVRPAPIDPDEPKVCLSEDPEVRVHVYDLWGVHRKWPRGFNSFVSTRFGLFHTSVEVYGREWCFCGTTDTIFHGVYAMVEPKKHPDHKYRKTIAMGRTSVSRADLEELMPTIRLKWPGWSYHVGRRNCHHFSDFFCQCLGFPAGPRFGLFASGDPKLAEAGARSFVSGFGCAGFCGRRTSSDQDSNPIASDAPFLPGPDPGCFPGEQGCV